MKRYKNLVRVAVILLLTMLTTTKAWADDYRIVVWFNDGNKAAVDFTDNPLFTYADGNITLKTDKGNASWPLSELRKLTFKAGDDNTQTIAVKTDDGGVIETKVEVETKVEDDGQKTATITSAEPVGTEEGNSSVAIPAEVVVGGTTYQVTEIAENAFQGKTEVTDIYLPDTEEPIEIGTDALKISDTQVATVHTSLALLDDYALNPQLKQNVETENLKSTVKAPNKYWTFSCGIDVVIPDNIYVYKCVIEDGTRVKITQIDENLLIVNGKRTIKANNGVLVGCPADDTVNAYEIVAKPGSQTIIEADTDAKSYGENWLEPVIKSKSYPSSDYYVLKDNQFHSILDNGSKVPACKAVLKKPAGVFASRSLSITGAEGTTGISSVDNEISDTESIYDMQGRKVINPAKGVYIKNGKKVVIK